MPRYFFHLFDGEMTHDWEGVELASVEAAVMRASTEARAMAASEVSGAGRLSLNHYVLVAGPDGTEIVRVYFSDVVKVGRPPELNMD